MTKPAVENVASSPVKHARFESLFTATIQFTSESPADALVPPEGREGAYLGSGHGIATGGGNCS